MAPHFQRSVVWTPRCRMRDALATPPGGGSSRKEGIWYVKMARVGPTRTPAGAHRPTPLHRDGGDAPRQTGRARSPARRPEGASCETCRHASARAGIAEVHPVLHIAFVLPRRLVFVACLVFLQKHEYAALPLLCVVNRQDLSPPSHSPDHVRIPLHRPVAITLGRSGDGPSGSDGATIAAKRWPCWRQSLSPRKPGANFTRVTASCEGG